MAINLTYYEVGEGLVVNGTRLVDFYGNDFNPTVILPSTINSMSVANQTYDFDLDGFQPGHEVGCGVFKIENDGESNVSFTMYGDFQRYKNGTWTTSWNYIWSGTLVAQGGYYYGYMYFGVDDDEIWDGYIDYRIRWRCTGGGTTITEYTNFITSRLNIDSNLYTSGCLRIDGENLCYTDGLYGNRGYKHKIAYDSHVYNYVGDEYAGSIWFEDSGATAMQRIYYVTENGYKTRTYGCQEWYGGDVNVGSSKAGSIRVPTGDMEYGYGHLCYVTATGQKLRVLNGPPY